MPATADLPELIKSARKSRDIASHGTLEVVRLASGKVSGKAYYDEAARVAGWMNTMLTYVRIGRSFAMFGFQSFSEGTKGLSGGKVPYTAFEEALQLWNERKLKVKPSDGKETAKISPKELPLIEDISETENLLYSCMGYANDLLILHRKLDSDSRKQPRVKRARQIIKDLLEEVTSDQSVIMRARVRAAAIRRKKASRKKS